MSESFDSNAEFSSCSFSELNFQNLLNDPYAQPYGDSLINQDEYQSITDSVFEFPVNHWGSNMETNLEVLI